MKYVYICSPYRPVGEDPETELRKNIDQAKRACRLAVSRGLIPLAPHLYFTQFLDDNDPQERNQPHTSGLKCLQQFIRYDFSRCKVSAPCFAKSIALIGCPGN